MKHLKFIILILLAGLCAYANSFSCSFHFDDFPAILNDIAIHQLHNWHIIWNVWPSRFLTFITLALNYHFNGDHVFGYHMVNLAIHLIASTLLYWLVYLILLTPAMKDHPISKHAPIIALCCGLVFVTHPLQTQAVTFIWQRSASMAGMFYLASLCFYIKSRSPCQHPVLTGFISLVAAVAAMFCKETSITLPLMILLCEFTFFSDDKKFNWPRVFPFLLTLLVIPLTLKLSGAQEIWSQHNGPTPNFQTSTSPLQYLLTELRVMWTYIRLCFVPVGQNLDYDYPSAHNLFALPIFISFISLIALATTTILIFKKERLIAFGILWFFLTLTPESTIFPFDDVIFEHRLYLPMAGFCIFLVSSLYELLGRHSLKYMLAIVALIVLGNTVLTYQRNQIWKDDISLWSDVTMKSPHKARGYNNLGLAFEHDRKFFEAIADFDKAIEINDRYAEGYNNRAGVYNQINNFAQAIADYDKAIELTPFYAEAYYNRGVAYASRGFLTQAFLDFNKAIKLYPNYAKAYNNRGVVLASEGKIFEATADFNKAIAIDPSYPDPYRNLGIIARRGGSIIR